MAQQPDQRHRRSIRLRGHDYAGGGVYFVTICTRDRELFFQDGRIRAIAEQCWLAIPQHHAGVELDEWVMMPNHVHGVIVLSPSPERIAAPTPGVQLNAPTREGGILSSPCRNTLGVVIRTFKAAVTTVCRREGYMHFGWQRNYYEHIVRNEAALNRIRQYIIDNPGQWETDENHPNRRVGTFN